MHSGLQCLLSISDMNCFFLKILKQYQKDINNKKLLRLLSITQAYQELVETIRISDGKEYIKVGTLRTLASKQFNPR
jgi:ubiquitin C-terminal hydrolase